MTFLSHTSVLQACQAAGELRERPPEDLLPRCWNIVRRDAFFAHLLAALRLSAAPCDTLHDQRNHTSRTIESERVAEAASQRTSLRSGRDARLAYVPDAPAGSLEEDGSPVQYFPPCSLHRALPFRVLCSRRELDPSDEPARLPHSCVKVTPVMGCSTCLCDIQSLLLLSPAGPGCELSALLSHGT
jgi:hypothetical protein